MGGKNQQPVSYSPVTKLIYAGINNLCMNYEGVEVQYIAGAPYVGANVRIFAGPGGNQGEFIAWDPVTAKRVWGIKEPFPVWTGTLVTAGDVVFYGTMDGWFKAVNAKTGTPLWKIEAAVGFDRQPDHLPWTGQEAVRRHLLGHRRLVRPPHRGEPFAPGSARGPRSGRRRVRRRARQSDLGRRHAARLRARVRTCHDGRRQWSSARVAHGTSSADGAKGRKTHVIRHERSRTGGRRSRRPPLPRVCGDPDNLPFSNEKLEGFENKIAASSPPISGRRRVISGGRTSVDLSGTPSTRKSATSSLESPKATTWCCGPSLTTARPTSSPTARTRAITSRRSTRRS